MEYICDNARHLICVPYSIENLHKMADELGIKRCWFHKNHYDIPKKRIDEITAKCEVVSSKEIVKIIKGMGTKQKLRENLGNTNIDGVVITRPNQELVIMRGIPGAGKSTEVEKLVGEGIVHSTDALIEATGDYAGHFKKMVESEDWGAHAKMHSQNIQNAVKSMKDGISPVIIDNTNIKMKDVRPYIDAALRMGFDDKNIRFVDIGTNGLTAEELTKRNTHNVPLETINEMIRIHKASGPLTVKRIVETRGTDKKVLYSAVVLDDKSRTKILTALGHYIPQGWHIICHHMTIVFGQGLPDELKGDLGDNVNLMVTEIGVSDMAIAVKVTGYKSANKMPHITLAVNSEAGGKPVMSNAITNWKKLDNYINAVGTVKEITN